MKFARTLEEAIEIAKTKISLPDDHDEESVVSGHHHTLGRKMRNDWGLWGGGDLHKELSKLGLSHPDDMSALIIKCAYRDLTGQDRDIDGIVGYYKDYWAQFSGAKLDDPSAKTREPA
jgi:hypothetical protein